MVVKETEDFAHSLGGFGGPIPRRPESGISVKPPDPVSQRVDSPSTPPRSWKRQGFRRLPLAASPFLP